VISPLATIRTCLSMLDAPLRRRWAWLVVLAVVAALLETVGTGAVFGLISVVADVDSLGRIPLLGAHLVEMARRDQPLAITMVGAGVIVFFVVKNGFVFFQVYNQERTGFDTTSRVAATLMRGYLHIPYAFHFHRNSAQLIQTLEYAVNDTFRVALLSAVVMMSEIFIALGLITVLLVSEPRISLITALILGGLMLLTYKATNAYCVRIGHRLQSLGAEVIQAMQQGLGAIKDVKILGREDHFCDAFAALYRERTRNQRNAAVVQQAPRLATETLMVVGMVLIIALVVVGGGDQAAVLPTLGLFGYAGFRLQPSLNRIVLYLNNIGTGAAAAAKLAKDWPELSAAAGRPLNHPEPLPFTRRLILDDIRYAYPGGDRQVLNGISLEIERGQSVGIVGTTGAGKSTLIDVILGLLSPTGGRVLVDGADIAADPRSWQRKIGYVPQVIFLTDDSLRRNIAFGLPDREVDESRLCKAVEMAQLADFVGSLPQGLDTRVGERGLNLSGGQRQRIGVARALYNEPDLLVFDEATSALDAETEREVSKAIDALSGTKTVILIAHRLSTLKNCDRIVMLKDGRISGQGTHQDLVEQNEDFRRMAELSALSV
jgi:ABC-type multidrug transport system fused ATPase/permease subunit